MNRQPHVCKECYKFLELSNYNANRKIKVTYIEKFKRDFKITRCCFRDITRILIPHVIETPRSSSGRLIYTYMHIHRPKHKVGILIIIMCYHVLSHTYSKLPRKDTPPANTIIPWIPHPRKNSVLIESITKLWHEAYY